MNEQDTDDLQKWQKSTIKLVYNTHAQVLGSHIIALCE